MKYMGSKRAMLRNGLGDVVTEYTRGARRFVDLFSGAGSVSWFVAEETQLPVLANDLQSFSAVLADAVIARTTEADAVQLKRDWLMPARLEAVGTYAWRKAGEVTSRRFNTRTWVSLSRRLCEDSAPEVAGPIWKAYGGHYFSPRQSLLLDTMLRNLPTEEPNRTICLAATITAASKCAASPGHTAQPFQPTSSAGPFLRESWKQDPINRAAEALEVLCPRHANVTGRSTTGDAVELAASLQEDDVVFVDPPYSGVHYSRFYHVLETIARGGCGAVNGAGRYPPAEERPRSAFSCKSESETAGEELLDNLAAAGVKTIVTFPSGECSNGLSGEAICRVAEDRFRILLKRVVEGRFSTLGGNNVCRRARAAAEELILVLSPR